METFNEQTLFLSNLAKKAGRILEKHYDPAGTAFTHKDDKSRVTETDIAVNKLVIEETKKHLPDYGVLGEELSFNETNKKLIVTDPLDGTLMFTLGLPLFCFSAAIVHDGVPVSAVIVNPIAKRTLLAEKGKGCMLCESNKFVQVRKAENLKDELVHCGWSSSVVASLVHEEGAKTPMVYSVCESGSLVAIGAFLGEFFNGKHAHDIAAVQLIVEEAGGKVTDIKGNTQRYDQPINGAIISNGVIHEKMLNMYRKAYGGKLRPDN